MLLRACALLAVSVVILIANFSHAIPVTSNLIETLAEAEDYLSVQPSVSSRLLKENLHAIHQLTTQNQLRWHQALLRASITLNDLEQVEATSRSLITYPELTEQTDKLVSLLSSLGIFLRRTGHHFESIGLFQCALKQPELSSKQQLSLLLSKGISLRQLNQLADAKVIYDQALFIATESQEEVFKSAIHNTIGILSLYENDAKNARAHFLESMQISQRILRRSGHLIAGLNLLLVSVLENDAILYKKLHYRISRLTLSSVNQDRHTYLLWLEKAHKVNSGETLTQSEQTKLIEALARVKSFSMHNMLVVMLATRLNMKVALRVKNHRPYQGDLLSYFPQCIDKPTHQKDAEQPNLP